MKTVIGLFRERKDLVRTCSQLYSEGLTSEQVRVLKTVREIRKYLDCNFKSSIMKHAAGGAIQR